MSYPPNGVLAQPSNGTIVTTAYDTFSWQADGLPIVNCQTGQAYLTSGTAPADLFITKAGKAAQGGGVAGTFGEAIMSLDAGGPVFSIEGEWTLEPGTPGNIVCMAITGDSTLSLTHLLHFIITDQAWNLQTTTTGPTHLYNISNGNFDPPLVADGTTRYRARMVADPQNNTVHLWLPGRLKPETITDPTITSAICGSRAYWEVIRYSDAQAEPRFTRCSLQTIEGGKAYNGYPDAGEVAGGIFAACQDVLGKTQNITPLKFTPTAAGNWLIWDGISQAAGGRLQISADRNGGFDTDVVVNCNVAAFYPTLNATSERYCVVGGGVTDGLFLGNDGTNHLYIGLAVNAAGVGKEIALQFSGPQVPHDFGYYMPSLITTLPSVNSVLAFGPGLNTLGPLAVQNQPVARYVGTLTTTASTSDTLTGVAGVDAGSHILLSPINSTAAGLTGVWAEAGTNSVTVNHPATSGAAFAIFVS